MAYDRKRREREFSSFFKNDTEFETGPDVGPSGWLAPGDAENLKTRGGWVGGRERGREERELFIKIAVI